MTEGVQPLVYRGDMEYYLPVEHFETYESALDEVLDFTGAEDDEIHYDGIDSIPLHFHAIDDWDECPNEDPEEPCLGYVKCHVFTA